MAENRPEALARLDVFVGEWAVEARFGAGEGPISGAWETGHDSGEWEHDFALTYRRIG